MFLAITFKTVVDTPAIDEVIEDLAADPQVVGVAGVAAVTHDEINQVYIEDDANQIAKNIAADRGYAYYSINFNPQFKPSLREVREVAGGRQAGPSTEVVEIEDEDGISLGSATVDA